MAQQWEDVIGDYKNILTNPVKNLLGKSFYFTMLKHKDNLNNEVAVDNDPLHMFETLHMALNPKKKGEAKYTYRGTKVTVDKTTKAKKVEEDVEMGIKKFANITGDVKNGLTFILNKYIHECITFHNSRSVKDDNITLQNLCTYVDNNISLPISSVICKIITLYDVEKIVDGNYANCSKQLVEKIRVYFKNDEDQAPEKSLGVLVDAYVKFMKVIAIAMTDTLFERRQAVSKTLFMGILRHFNSLSKQFGVKMEAEFLDNLKEFIEVNKPKKEVNGKKSKKKSEDDEETLDDDNEESNENETLDNIDEDGEVDDEINKLEDDDWSNGVEEEDL